MRRRRRATAPRARSCRNACARCCASWQRTGRGEMALLNLFKLEKLHIYAFTDVRRKRPASPRSMEMMFNPETYSRAQVIEYQSEKLQGINTPGRPARYA